MAAAADENAASPARATVVSYVGAAKIATEAPRRVSLFFMCVNLRRICKIKALPFWSTLEENMHIHKAYAHHTRTFKKRFVCRFNRTASSIETKHALAPTCFQAQRRGSYKTHLAHFVRYSYVVFQR